MASPTHPNPAEFIFAPLPALGTGEIRTYHENLLRGLAHKLNNQISVAHGFSSLLLMRDDLDPSALENLTHIKEAASQMTALLSRVLLLAGCSQLAAEPIETNAFLARLDQPMREIPHGKAVGFASSVAEDLPTITADPARLRELLLELIRNASEAAAGHGQVSFDVFGPGRISTATTPSIDFLIRNTGNHWPEKDIAQAFQPFFSTKGSEHTGLGLPGAAMLVHLMGGKLGVHGEGDTTTVWVSLPV